jgi:hypothetical protein
MEDVESINEKAPEVAASFESILSSKKAKQSISIIPIVKSSNDENETWKMPRNPKYQPYLVHLMSFVDSIIYPRNKTFSKADLLRLEPKVIQRWLSKRAYGKEEYDPKVDLPIHARSCSIEQAKKAVSFFMPNKIPAWVDGNGNPTKHSAVLAVIRDVKKAEGKHQGFRPKAKKKKRPLSENQEKIVQKQAPSGIQHLELLGAAAMLSNLKNRRTHMLNELQVLDSNIRVLSDRLATEGTRMRMQQASNMNGRPLQSSRGAMLSQAEQKKSVVLSNNPRTLEDLWREYKFGLNGRKPAEQFTSSERNSRIEGVKQKYYRRNVIWQGIVRMIEKGHTAAGAIKKIRGAYGDSMSISKLIDAMLCDRRERGGHPNLR